MKLLMVHSDRDEMYGAVHSMLELLTNLYNIHNVEPTILVSKEGNVTEYCKKMGWKYCVTGHGNFMMGAGTKKKEFIRNTLLPIFYLKYKIKNFFALKKIEKELDIRKYDVIHTNVNVCDIGAILSRKYNIPHFWHLREFGDLDYNRIVFKKNYINYMNEHCTKFIAISNSVKEHWIKKGLDKDKIQKIYNGVEPIEYGEKKKNYKKIKCCFCGSISKAKGQYLLFEALSKISKDLLSKIEIDVIGDGPTDYVNKIKKILSENNIKNVNFLGYKKDVREMLCNYDVGFMCSFSEGFGRVTIEYMMAGICTIASDTGANTELIKDGFNGIIFKYPDINDLAQKIEFLINNVSKIYDIGTNSKEYANNNFTSEINANKIFELYKKEVGEKNEK